ncbi:MAG: primosomal protein [Nesterenkonia sp.]|nr:primosomal protein [Nesterenkonia sp.]
MNIDPRVALASLTNALEEHLNAAMTRRGDEDPAVESAFYGVADAFEAYEDALFAASGEVTPLDLYDEDEEDDEEDEDFDGGDESDDADSEEDSDPLGEAELNR